MLDFTIYQSAKQHMEKHANEALPTSPVRPDAHRRTFRHRVSIALHRLAEQLDPHPVMLEPPAHVTAE